MASYIVRNPQPSQMIPERLLTSIIERKRLLLKMTSSRHAVRVLCAPSLFGKTVLALQYAKVLFADQCTIWVSADVPEFLRDLETGDLMESIAALLDRGQLCDLFVFDAVPELDDRQEADLKELVLSLRESEYEVVVTTRSRRLFINGEAETQYLTASRTTGGLPSAQRVNSSVLSESTRERSPDDGGSLDREEDHERIGGRTFGRRRGSRGCEGPFVFIMAEDLLFNSGEASKMLPLGASAPRLRMVPPIFCDMKKGRDRLMEALRHVTLASLEDAMAMTALVLRTGDRAVLDKFIEGFSELDEADFSGYYPHAGLQSDGFAALELTDQERLSLLNAHIADLIKCSSYDSEREYLEHLLGEMLKAEDYGLVQMIVMHRLNETERSRFYADNDVDEAKLAELIAQRELALVGFPDLQDGQGRSPTNAKDEFFARRGDPLLRSESGSVSAPIISARPDQLIINLFGRFELRRGNVPIPEKGEIRKLAKIMIALLVVNYKKDLPRNWVERSVWPGCHSASLSSNFYNLWSYIKRALSRDEEERKRLGRTREAISLRALDYDSDVIRVDKLCNEFSVAHDAEDCARIMREIELLYQGPLLPGLDNAQLESYRNKFHNKVLDVFVEGTRIIFAKGDKYSALHFSSFAFGLDIAREDVCYTYMHIQRELGHYTGAIDAYLECRGALVEEYGIDAPRRLDALYGEIIKELSS